MIRKWLCQLLIGLSEIHSNKIIHRDIKPSNIFINSDFNLVIGDFGSAVVTSKPLNSFVGSALYLAPEVVKDQPYTKAIDIWGVGLVLFELMHRENYIRGESVDLNRHLRYFNKHFK